MNNEHLNQMLKEHYESRRLSNSRATNILANCEIARTAYLWRVRAITAMSLAASAMIALAIVLYGTQTIPPAEKMQAQAPLPAPANQPKLVAVMIRATNCPNSKAMEPIFAKLQQDFVGESVLFIKFDYSSDCARHQAELLSRDLGLATVFEQYKKTGDIVLVSPRGKVREVIDRSINIAAATETLRKTVEHTL